MRERRGLRGSLLGALALVVSLALPAPALALTLTVNSTADEADALLGDGICLTAGAKCTLRAAFEQANLHNAPGNEDSIVLPAGKYELAEGVGVDDFLRWGGFSTGDALTVDGAGAAVTTIDQNAVGSEVILSTAPLSLEGVTVTGGNDAEGGGGIESSDADLTLEGVSVTGNTADVNGGGGIRFAPGAPEGELTIVESTISGNTAEGGGGGIQTAGPTTIEDSRIAGNTAGTGSGAWPGGGIYFFGSDPGDDLRITGSTISGNQTDGSGGGIWFKEGELALLDSTLSGNSAAAGGGIQRYAEGTASHAALTHVTVAGNTAPQGSGIDSHGPGTLSLQATILSGNGCAASFGGTIDSLGHNLASGSTCLLNEPGDQPSTDAQLGPLQDNGGPTPTHALAATSPALDAAVAAGLATDQRGLARADLASVANAPGGDGADVGAFELQPGEVGTPGPGGGGSGGAGGSTSPGSGDGGPPKPTVIVDRAPALELVAKPRQRPARLRVQVGCASIACSIALGGRATVPVAGDATNSARPRSFRLKPKTVTLGAGATAVVPLRFKRHRASVRAIRRMLDQLDARARKNAKVRVEATASGGIGRDAGVVTIGLVG